MNAKKSEFDEKAKTWDARPDQVERTRIIADAISKSIPNDPSFTAMEYGCGTGLLSFPLRNRFKKITLIDSSSGMLEVVKEKIEKENVSNMETLNIDLLDPDINLDRTFSAIYSSMVLHHVTDVQKILSIWYSLLSKPGYICINDLDSDKGLFHGDSFNGHNGFDRKELGEMASKAGFVNIHFTTPYIFRKVAKDGVERGFPLFLMVACKE